MPEFIKERVLILLIKGSLLLVFFEVEYILPPFEYVNLKVQVFTDFFKLMIFELIIIEFGLKGRYFGW